MTGSGTHVLDAPAGRIEVEARSVNHRFLKSSVRVDGPLPGINDVVEGALRDRIRRGHVTVFVRFRPGAVADFAGRIHEESFAAAARHLRDLAAAHGVGTVTLADVLAMPGVLADASDAGDDDALRDAVAGAVTAAVGELQSAREREGRAMTDEVERILSEVAGAVSRISELADSVPQAYRARLEKRIAELLEGTGHAPDDAQIARECALVADRADVREEIARLEAHVTHVRELLAAGGPVGRRLDFLVQELHREASTIASKSSDLALAQTVLDLRAGVERLREQVQNLE
jgi:uncharacterized protein (TIGR00255 family)